MVDKKHCMSSYSAFRYIEDKNKDFADGFHHQNIPPLPDEERILVHTAQDIDREIMNQFSEINNKNLA